MIVVPCPVMAPLLWFFKQHTTRMWGVYFLLFYGYPFYCPLSHVHKFIQIMKLFLIQINHAQPLIPNPLPQPCHNLFLTETQMRSHLHARHGLGFTRIPSHRLKTLQQLNLILQGCICKFPLERIGSRPQRPQHTQFIGQPNGSRVAYYSVVGIKVVVIQMLHAQHF